MNIGILTFQFAHNYGAMLQCYALKSFLEKQGQNVTVINYWPIKIASYYSLNPWYALKRHDIAALTGNIIRWKQAEKFYTFQKDYLKLKRKVNTVDDNYVAGLDAVIVGSDQVWNSDIVPDLGEYLLANCSACNKYSYSASLGKKNFSRKAELAFKAELPFFNAVSVRESNTALLLSNALGISIQHTVDPVFLLCEEEWERIYSGHYPSNVDKNYILIVDLFNDDKIKKDAYELATKKGLALYSIDPMCRNHDTCSINLHNIGPLEYLWLINNAQYIATNSFHAVAFSYIFRKKVIFCLKDELSNRIDDLFSCLNVRNTGSCVDFSAIGSPEIFQNKIKESMQYLMDIINSETDQANPFEVT